ncbi:LysR family transcriptional regulator [Pseudorhodobacter ferrugineus]|uniref:LysR family transcriptional regulator n=1 Tax=Pseudorhodobacter ferrugineus TaxID=77008 RepID=UPI0003B72326|nr:LysR family transcriptional regulator [Pseudorhodobacter ferrugineus]
MDLSDLRLFVAIAEAGNLTLGAQRAFLSPPAASARIKALETSLAQPLLYRGNRGVSLTKSGEALLRHARLILRQIEFLKDDLGAADRGHVRIFANTTAVTEFMPEILARFLADRPKVTVDLQERLTQDIQRGILDGTADLGITSGPIPDAGLQAIRFSTDHLLLATPRNHPLAAQTSVSFADTLAYEHIGLHEGSTLLAFLRGLMERHGYDRALRIQVRSFEAMCRMVEAGVGIGITPESAARRHAKTMDIALITISDPWAIRDRSVLVRDIAALPHIARALVDELVKAGAGGRA